MLHFVHIYVLTLQTPRVPQKGQNSSKKQRLWLNPESLHAQIGIVTRFVQKHSKAGAKFPKCLVVSFKHGKVALKTNHLTLPIYRIGVGSAVVEEGRNKEPEETLQPE